MKYMTFKSSCSYCCIANLLEAHGISREDRDIALEMGLPCLFSYDEEEKAYQAGAMLQGKYWFDRYLGTLGFRFIEVLVPQKEAERHLREHIPCMIGLKGESGKHAMICLGHQEGTYRFLNPHRAGDGEPDERLFSSDDLQAALSETNPVGFIEPTGAVMPMNREDYEDSLRWLSAYQKDVRGFCGQYRTKGEIMAAVNTLFRPFAVDGLAMIELAGETVVAHELRQFQAECMTLFRTGDCTPDEVVDMARFDRIVRAYEILIRKKLDQ